MTRDLTVRRKNKKRSLKGEFPLSMRESQRRLPPAISVAAYSIIKAGVHRTASGAGKQSTTEPFCPSGWSGAHSLKYISGNCAYGFCKKSSVPSSMSFF